ncbi:MAG: ribonuclease III [Rickettsiales bacterium]|nr:ribonuclease III [Rickettsiales bacterium]
MTSIFGYQFKNDDLFEQALTHSSLGKNNYELLEFLGDKVIALVISEHLFLKSGKRYEGTLAKKHAYLASGEVLAEIAFNENIDQFIKVSFGERKEGGHQNPANLEDCLESLIGAIYLDSDLRTVSNIILKLWDKYLKEVEANIPVDPKSKLQEIIQKRRIELPSYKIINQTGLDHKPIFTVQLSVRGYDSITTEASSKKEAEKELARKMIAILEQNDK